MRTLTLRSLPLIALMGALFLPSACKKTSTSTDGGSDVYVPADHNQPNALKAGAGEQIIDLPVGHPTAGYAQSKAIGFVFPTDDTGSPYADMFPATRGVYAPPYAKVLVLDNRDGPSDPHHSRLVLAKIDAVGITDILGERVIQLAKEQLGEDISNELILNATHTHDAGCRFSRESMVPNIIDPSVYPPNYLNALAHGFDTYSQESTDKVAGAIVGALKQALQTLRPAKFGYGSAMNNFADNDRRCENDHLYGPDYVNKKVTVLRVDDAMTGDPIAVAFNYAMHGTVYDADNRNLSVDAPAHAEYMVEEQFQKPVVAMYIQGDAADVSPNGRGNDGSQAMQAAGYSIAQTVMQAYSGIQTTSVLPLQVLMRWSPVSYDILGYKPGEFYQDGAILCFELFGNFDCAQGGGTHDPSDIVSQNICTAQAVPGGGKYFTRFATARIGDLALVAMPGEPSTKLGEEIVAGGKAQGFADVITVGYALDHMGYLMVDEDWLSGGYEPTITFWGWKFARYAENQGLDLLAEMMTGKAAKKLPATIADMTPDKYTRVATTDSMQAPAIDQDAPASVTRMTSLEVSFFGGDPGLGMPVATLQTKGSDGSFSDYKINGWIPVSNEHGYYMATRYEATPTYKDAPMATSRQHHWTVHYEPPPSLPAGTYRLHITGNAQTQGKSSAYDLTSAAFQLVPSTNLSLKGGLAASNGNLVFDAILLYPQGQPKYATKPSAGWQLDNFLLYTPRYGNGFSPAQAGSTLPMASVVKDTTGDAQPVALTFQTPDVDPAATQYAPGQGPGLHAQITGVTTGHYELDLPSVTDEFGNTAPAATFAVDVP